MKDKHAEDLQTLQKMTDDLRFCMITTIAEDGGLRSRPMTNQRLDDDGCLWFFTSTESELAEDIAARPDVNVAFSKPDDNTWVSVSGRATQVEDRAKIKELWNPMVEAWFPDGPDDPKVELIRVDAHDAEYWDADSTKMVRLFKMAAAYFSGKPPDMGEHGTIKM
ncbi:MAG TPA: pyridoxamine 5'-phosphate oxidase family protein [Burkholderiaceae bacterium]